MDEELKKTFENIDNIDKDDWEKNKREMKEKKEVRERGEILEKTLTDALKGVLEKRTQAEQIIDVQPMYYDTSKNWWLWDIYNFKWVRVDEVDILNSINKLCDLNTINSKERTELIEALKQVSRLHQPRAVINTWVQFKDTIYDIETGDVFKATPEYFVTNPIPYQIHPDKFMETPTMDRVFTEWVGKENIQKLYEILAYCILTDYPLHRIFCFIGAGMNGKSCFLTLMKKFIGRDNICSTELDTLLNSKFEVSRLHKKLVCMMGETNFNEMNKTSMLKKLSGGDLIGFEYKNKDLFEDVNYAKLIIATNNLPATSDKTIGFYRRWMIIDFPNTFSEQEDIISLIPEEEYESLALKCTFILKDLLDKRKFTNEGTVEERMEIYESKSNFLEEFVKKFTIQDSSGHITKKDFYRKFSAWSKEHRHREMAENSVGLGMKKIGVETGRKYFDWLFDGKGGQLYCYVGIKWVD